MSEAYGRLFAANIPKYFIYKALQGISFGLVGAMWVIFLTQHRGLTLAQASLVDVSFFVVAAFGEVPTGIVADKYGRRTSLIIGTAMMSIGILGWTLAPTLPLIMLSYVGMGLGFTFLSGADDSLFYESVKLAGREDDYTRLIGRVGAVFTGALAVGSVISGVLASITLTLPMLLCGLGCIGMLGVVLAFREPRSEDAPDGEANGKSFRAILGQSFSLMRARPTLLYPMIYLALVPVASFITEVLLLQPQAVALGVPLAGIGVLVMAVQLTSMVGSNVSDRVKTLLGESRLIYTFPLAIIVCLILMAAFQVLPVLAFVAVIGFFTAVIRPILLTRIQNEVSDTVRATIISMNSLMFTVVGAIGEVSMGFLADRSGFPTAYVVLASALFIGLGILFWKSRAYFPDIRLLPEARVEAQADAAS